MTDTLETRLCACGCGLSWRTLASSPNHFALWQHAQIALHSTNAERKAKAKAYFEERKERLAKRPRKQNRPIDYSVPARESEPDAEADA